jgi:hypothetical protein
MAADLRIQIVSEPEVIETLSRAAAAANIATTLHENRTSDQRFGLVEAAAVIAIVKSVAEVAQLLAKTYKALKGRNKITVKTPKGSVTIEGDAETPFSHIREQIENAGIL